jgi:hypothetical protein
MQNPLHSLECGFDLVSKEAVRVADNADFHADLQFAWELFRAFSLLQ